MKKVFLLLLGFAFVCSTHAQVGINTESPNATMDIVAGKTDDTTAEGIIAPKLTLAQLAAKDAKYTANYQTGTIIYVTDVSGTTTAKTVNVTTIGYYYFDGTVWKAFNTDSSSANAWTLTGNTGTSPATNYIGTSDASDLVVKTSAAERIRVAANGNVGIGTNSPNNILHIKATSDPVKIEGLVVSSSNDDVPLVIGSDGIVKTGTFTVPNIVPTEVGTVIAINGQLVVAQEIVGQMTADFISSAGGIVPIGNITQTLIDNKNTFTASSTNNTFRVMDDGTYLVTINVQLMNTGGTTNNPVVGIQDLSTGQWVARVNDYTTAGNLQTFTLISAIPMQTGRDYSFALANVTGGTLTIKAFSSGGTGSGPISYFSVKRLK